MLEIMYFKLYLSTNLVIFVVRFRLFQSLPNIKLSIFMGSFIHVGLITKIKLSKYDIKEWQDDSRRKPEKIEATDTNGFVAFIEEEIKKGTGIDLAIFTKGEDKDSFFWEISQKVFQKEFLDFLKTFAAAYSTGYNSEVIQSLSKTTPDKWFEVIEKEEFYYCRFDSYDDIRLSSARLYPSIELKLEQIELTMEGKVSFEEMGKHLGLFTLGIKELFSQYKIAKNLNIFML